MSQKILYVEDDPTLGFVTADTLSEEGYEVVLEKDGVAAFKRFKKESFDICILDVMMPEMDGFELAEKIRKLNSQVPIIFLTAKSLKEDKLEGLTIGADDYITKPFSIEELILKVQIFLKRKYVHSDENELNLEIGHFNLDYANLTLRSADSEQVMTQKEADLLKELIKNKNNILKREEILERLWGKNDYFLGRSMDVFISRLRKHLKSDIRLKIENVHSVGFRLIEEI
ncbi:MAG: response regulator transcription factor [Saprospiraceae bacterium]